MEKQQKRISVRKAYRKGSITRRVNYLRTVISVQDIVKKFGRAGMGYSQRWIYDNVITGEKSNFNMSYSTFNKCLSVPGPRTELEKLQTNEKN